MIFEKDIKNLIFHLCEFI